MAPIPGDELFMRMAIAEAAQADFPFGAVIVRDGNVVAAGRNQGTSTNDPTAHGEMVAIRRFVAARPAGELKGTTLYTSGEPCPMCMGAILCVASPGGLCRLYRGTRNENWADHVDQPGGGGRRSLRHHLHHRRGALARRWRCFPSEDNLRKSARSSASGLLTALLAGILERRAIRLARSLITTNNALFLLLAIRTLRPAGLGVGPATCLAGFGLTDLDLSARWILPPGKARRSP